MRAMVALSGGVDSSAAALVLKEAGYDVMGGMLSLHGEKDTETVNGCCTTQDVIDAQGVCKRLGIPFFLFHHRDDFKEKVIDKFVATYCAGGTPNPCVDCNRDIKFKFMLEMAAQKDCGVLATGHYAKNEYDEKSGRYILKKAADLSKDQSYVLYSLTQEQLAKIIFPLGGMNKQDVRTKAQQAGLDTAQKSDSQDICFIPDGDYVSFIERYMGESFPPGDFVDKSGNVLGRHKGIIGYTIGQRKGLGLALPAPMYVVEKDLAANEVVLGSESELYTTELEADNINLISVERIDAPLRCKARVRYKQNEQWATVSPAGENTLRIVFDEPQRAVAAGQAVVLYDGDIVIGGGTIK